MTHDGDLQNGGNGRKEGPAYLADGRMAVNCQFDVAVQKAKAFLGGIG